MKEDDLVAFLGETKPIEAIFGSFFGFRWLSGPIRAPDRGHVGNYPAIVARTPLILNHSRKCPPPISMATLTTSS
jgi:hypothetical protein